MRRSPSGRTSARQFCGKSRDLLSASRQGVELDSRCPRCRRSDSRCASLHSTGEPQAMASRRIRLVCHRAPAGLGSGANRRDGTRGSLHVRGAGRDFSTGGGAVVRMAGGAIAAFAFTQRDGARGRLDHCCTRSANECFLCTDPNLARQHHCLRPCGSGGERQLHRAGQPRGGVVRRRRSARRSRTSSGGNPNPCAGAPVSSHVGLRSGTATRLRGAIQHYSKFLTVVPWDSEVRQRLGGVLLETGEYGTALAQYNEALRYELDAIPPRIGIARALIAQRRFADARGLLDRILQQDAENHEAQELLRTIRE